MKSYIPVIATAMPKKRLWLGVLLDFGVDVAFL